MRRGRDLLRPFCIFAVRHRFAPSRAQFTAAATLVAVPVTATVAPTTRKGFVSFVAPVRSLRAEISMPRNSLAFAKIIVTHRRPREFLGLCRRSSRKYQEPAERHSRQSYFTNQCF